jgi:hypothetical protein
LIENKRVSLKTVSWKNAQKKAALTARWAVTMAKVRIRRVASRTRWQLVTFYGKSGGESVGVVDLLAVRKDHGAPSGVIRRGDALQIILIQIKGGTAAMPTFDDAARLRAVAKRHGAYDVLLATWKKGTMPRFFRLRRATASSPWAEITNLDTIFR